MQNRRPVHRTIVVFDVAGFGDRRRTNRHQVAVRKGLYQIVADAFRQAGIPWDVSACQDRGDGIFILLAPEVPKSLLAESLPAALVAELNAHNMAHPRQEQIRLRMALHAGEVSYDEYGVTAASVNLTFRLLDAEPLKAALAAAPGVLAIIVSSWFFEEVIRHIPIEGAASYRPVVVSVKETTTTGWICLPDHPSMAPEATADDAPDIAVSQADRAGSDTSVRPPPRVPVATAGLPADEGFTGRQDELFALTTLLAPSAAQTESVLVFTIAGPAGVGKTALCVHAARKAVAAGWYPGGVLFVDLHGYDGAGQVEPGAAVAALLRALGVVGERIPPSLGEREALYRSELAAMAERGERVLVVADNASNLEQVLALRPGGLTHRMLVTSRHTLPVPGARRIEVDILSEDESVAVIAQALRMAGRGDERIFAEPDAAAELVRLCGYLPLALRIAAELLADKPAQPIRELVSILAGAVAERLDELAYGDSVGVRVAFDASYRLLPADVARVFRRMALHPGPQINVAAVAALAGTSEIAARRLADAVRRAHLIQSAAEPGSYRFHDLLHLYAVSCCNTEEEPAERDAAINRLLEYYWKTISGAVTHLDPHVAASDRSTYFADRMEAVCWLENERPNLVSIVGLAADTGHDIYVRDIPLALIFFFYLRRHLDEWLSTTEAALAAARRIGDRGREGRALSSLGNAHFEMREWNLAQDFFQRTLDICEAEHDRSREARTLTNLGNISYELRSFEEGLAYYHKSLAIYQEIGESYSEGQTWNNIGYTHGSMRRHDDAIGSYERSLSIFREIGEVHGQGVALTNLGASYHALRRSKEAIGCHRQALAIFQRTGDQLRGARALANLGEAYQGIQRNDEALDCYHQALSAFRAIADRYGEGATLASLASTYRDSGRVAEALDYYQRALAVFDKANAADDADRVRTRIAELTESYPREPTS